MPGITGNGATFALTTISGGATAPSGIGRVVSISELVISGEAIPDPDLTTTLMKYLPGDIKSIDSLTLQVAFDEDTHTSLMVSNLLIPYDGTLTFPLQSGDSTAANLDGSGFFTSIGTGSLENDTRSEATLVWQYDNQDTVLAYNAST